MGMSIKLNVFEALTEAGVKPEAARAVEREIESAIKSGHDEIRAEWREQLMTKTDGAGLETRLNARLNDQLRWIITTQIAVVGLAVAAMKLL